MPTEEDRTRLIAKIEQQGFVSAIRDEIEKVHVPAYISGTHGDKYPFIFMIGNDEMVDCQIAKAAPFAECLRSGGTMEVGPLVGQHVAVEA